MTGGQVPERIRWAVRTMAPDPDDHLLEIGCGPGVAVAHICQQLAGGRIVAIDRSATAIDRAARRNAACVTAGTAVLRPDRAVLLTARSLTAPGAELERAGSVLRLVGADPARQEPVRTRG